MEETETTAKKRRRCTYNKDWEDIYPWAAADWDYKSARDSRPAHFGTASKYREEIVNGGC